MVADEHVTFEHPVASARALCREFVHVDDGRSAASTIVRFIVGPPGSDRTSFQAEWRAQMATTARPRAGLARHVSNEVVDGMDGESLLRADVVDEWSFVSARDLATALGAGALDLPAAWTVLSLAATRVTLYEETDHLHAALCGGSASDHVDGP
jgi:hypothetical protein